MHAVLAHDDLTTIAPVPHDCVVVLDEATSLSGHALARAADVLDQQPSVGIVFVATGEQARDGVQPGHRWLREAAAHGIDTVGSRCAVLRRATFEAAGQQGLGTRSGELSLWLRAAALADVAHVAEPLPLGALTLVHVSQARSARSPSCTSVPMPSATCSTASRRCVARRGCGRRRTAPSRAAPAAAPGWPPTRATRSSRPSACTSPAT